MKRRSLPLRRRLALGTSAVIAVLVGAFALATLLAAGGHVLTSAATSAQGIASDVIVRSAHNRTSLAEKGRFAPDADDLQEFNSPAQPQVWIERAGAVRLRSPNATASPPDPAGRGLLLSQAVWRAVGVAPAGYRVVVDLPMGQDLALLRELLLVLMLGALATASLGALVSRSAVHRVLDPVDRMTAAAARTIEGGARFELPTLPDEPDEFTRLASVLNRLVANLEERNRRERHFLAQAAHELRTPLAVMSGNLDLLTGWGGDDSQVRSDSIDALQRTVGRMRRLVNDLLTLERAPGRLSQRVPVDLRAVAAEMAEDGAALAAHLRVEADASAEPVAVLADPDSVRRIAWAFLENAIDYTPAGGRVRLRVGKDRDSGWLRVEDTGPGVAPEERERVFESFYRGAPPGQEDQGRTGHGLGLGLAIARAMATALDGSVRLDSAEGGGTLAELRLPRVH